MHLPFTHETPAPSLPIKHMRNFQPKLVDSLHSPLFWSLSESATKMNWNQIIFISLLATVLILAIANEAESAAVRTDKSDIKTGDGENLKKRIFMQESEATAFLKRRGRRSTKSKDEVNAENRQRLAADERRREYYEEQRNEFENYVEEERDEQQERNREKTEQWREYHYDGLYPSYQYNRHHI
ncbi:unique cartilage matrix-associated protein-like [Acipenser ruthenus]|uniref:unique cartilage matrix-associated protein-like n=1 Tax=Acipenser ruthenus TaxID=7906 RepID=UPI0027412C65|nr:unique cartilage matrix-associated protein-like [Acipenser ruthenus]